MKLTNIILLSLIVIIIGCSKKIEPSRPAEAWLKDGLTQYSQKEYKDAIKSFENAIKEADNPQIAAKAQLYLGNSYYERKKYDEAIPSYEEYLHIYSDSPDAPEAIYKLGMCYYHQLKPIDKDQTFTIEALKNFQKLHDKYPKFSKKFMVDKKIAELRNMLAENKLYIAKFYLRTDKEKAAEIQLRKILKKYKDTPTYPKATLVLSKYLMNQKGREEEAMDLLQNLLKQTKSKKDRQEAHNIMKKLLK